MLAMQSLRQICAVKEGRELQQATGILDSAGRLFHTHVTRSEQNS